MFEYTDPGMNDMYVFNYIVGQLPDEKDILVFQKVIETEDSPNGYIDPDGFKPWPEDVPIPSEVAGHFFGELHPGSGFDVPTFFETFAAIRAARDELKLMLKTYDFRRNTVVGRSVLKTIEIIDTYGDLDENYGSISRAALDGDLKCRGMLSRLAQE